MITGSYIEIPSSPAVRSAWDAVKSNVTGAVASSSAATLSGVCTLAAGYAGDSAMAAVWGGLSILNGAFAVRNAYRIRRALSDLPAPRP